MDEIVTYTLLSLVVFLFVVTLWLLRRASRSMKEAKLSMREASSRLTIEAANVRRALDDLEKEPRVAPCWVLVLGTQNGIPISYSWELQLERGQSESVRDMIHSPGYRILSVHVWGRGCSIRDAKVGNRSMSAGSGTGKFVQGNLEGNVGEQIAVDVVRYRR